VAAEKHETMKLRLFQQRLEGKVVKVAPDSFSNLSNIANTATIMKRE
jgi:hypothetical protein